jgi:cytochrome d ubiquinol oxidase subunit II
VLVAISIASLIATIAVRPSTLTNYYTYPIAFLIPVLVVATLGGIYYFGKAGRIRSAFACSCAYLALMMTGAAVGLYPALLPSSTDPSRDITIAKSLSGEYALSVGLIWWTLGILIAIGYFVFVYRMFAGKVRITESNAH